MCSQLFGVPAVNNFSKCLAISPATSFSPLYFSPSSLIRQSILFLFLLSDIAAWKNLLFLSPFLSQLILDFFFHNSFSTLYVASRVSFNYLHLSQFLSSPYCCMSSINILIKSISFHLLYQDYSLLLVLFLLVCNSDSQKSTFLLFAQSSLLL